jgi:hypothetical protein
MGTKRLRNSSHHNLTMDNADLLDQGNQDDELVIQQGSIYDQKSTSTFIGEKIGVGDVW